MKKETCPIGDITCPYSHQVGSKIYCTLDDMIECDDYCYFNNIFEDEEE